MATASLSITPPNNAWIKSQIENEELSSRSDVVTHLIRKARKEQDEGRVSGYEKTYPKGA